MIGVDAVLDDLGFGVVHAVLDFCTVADALENGLVGDHEGDHGVDLSAAGGEDLVEMLGLGRGAREAVEDETFDVGMRVEFRGDHAFDHLVGNEQSLVNEGFGLQAKGRAGCDFAAQQVARRDVAKSETIDDERGLGAFAGARRAEDQEMFAHRLGRICVEDVNVFVIAAQLVVVEAEAHDKTVFDFHGHVVELEVFFVDFGLEEHGADLHVGGAGVEQQGVQVGDGLAGVDDVFHHDDRPALDGRSEAQHLAGHAGGEGPFVGGEAHARELAGKVEAFHELAREEDRSVEHAEHDRNAVKMFEIVVDALRHVIDGLLQPLVRNVRNEILVFKQDSVHHR